MPWGNSRNERNAASCTCAHSAISTKSSPPPSTPQNPKRITSTSGCLRFAHWRRGSAIVCNFSTKAHVIAAIRGPPFSRISGPPSLSYPLLLTRIQARPPCSFDEALNDPQLRHNQTIVEYDHPIAGHVRGINVPGKFSE